MTQYQVCECLSPDDYTSLTFVKAVTSFVITFGLVMFGNTRNWIGGGFTTFMSYF